MCRSHVSARMSVLSPPRRVMLWAPALVKRREGGRLGDLLPLDYRGSGDAMGCVRSTISKSIIVHFFTF
jgi:hypothetical protein